MTEDPHSYQYQVNQESHHRAQILRRLAAPGVSPPVTDGAPLKALS